MPTPTYTPLATVTLGSSAASVTFSSIPATYRDLVFVYNGNTTSSGANDLQFRLNNDTSNTTSVTMYADAGGRGSFTQNHSLANYGSDIRTVFIAQVMDYSATNKHKTTIIRGSSTAVAAAHAMRFASTSAVTSIVFAIAVGTFVSGSTFSLYGITA
jgi:hypothetical protein